MLFLRILWFASDGHQEALSVYDGQENLCCWFSITYCSTDTYYVYVCMSSNAWSETAISIVVNPDLEFLYCGWGDP